MEVQVTVALVEHPLNSLQKVNVRLVVPVPSMRTEMEVAIVRQLIVFVYICSPGCFIGCHSSCLACVVSSNGSGSACVDCNQNRFLKGEQCVSDCGVGYYPSSGRCTGVDGKQLNLM